MVFETPVFVCNQRVTLRWSGVNSHFGGTQTTGNQTRCPIYQIEVWRDESASPFIYVGSASACFEGTLTSQMGQTQAFFRRSDLFGVDYGVAFLPWDAGKSFNALRNLSSLGFYTGRVTGGAPICVGERWSKHLRRWAEVNGFLGELWIQTFQVAILRGGSATGWRTPRASGLPGTACRVQSRRRTFCKQRLRADGARGWYAG